ncbi:MAG: hypothetical protein ACM3NW_07970 [Syntrophomonadaceae bacterium]
MDASTALQPFPVSIEHGRLEDAASPERAVAHDEAWLIETLEASGLARPDFYPGYWKGQPGLEYQDILVASRMDRV